MALRIGELARRTGVGVSTLRAWERRFELLQPSRSPSGQRVYDDGDIERVETVVRLVAEGLTLPAAVGRVRLAGAGARAGGEGEWLLYQQVLAAAPAGIWVTREGRTLFANRRMLSMMGCSYEELAGVPLPRFFRDEELPLVRERTTAVRGGQPLHFRQELHRPDGTTFLADIESIPLRPADGPYEGTVSVVRDVGAEVEAGERARFDAALLELVPDAAFATAGDGRVVSANPATHRILGWPVAEVTGRDVRRLLLLPEGSRAFARIVGALEAGRSYRGTHEVLPRGGAPFPARILATPVVDDDGRVLGVATSIRDETEAAASERQARTRELQADTVARLGVRALAARDGVADALTTTEVLAAARRLLGAEAACLLDADLRVIATSAAAGAGCPACAPIADYVLRAQHATVVADASDDRRFDHDGEHPGSAVAAPVPGAPRSRGVLVVTSGRRDTFEPQAVSFVQSLANVLATLWPPAELRSDGSARATS